MNDVGEFCFKIVFMIEVVNVMIDLNRGDLVLFMNIMILWLCCCLNFFVIILFVCVVVF